LQISNLTSQADAFFAYVDQCSNYKKHSFCL